MLDTNNNPKGGRRASMKRKVVDTSIANVSTASAKKTKVVSTIPPVKERGYGQLHSFGMNDCGQLGLDPDVSKRNYPSLVEGVKDNKIVQVICGGMHTIGLDAKGDVYTFGLNDDYALGRKTNEEEENFAPDKVDLGGRKVSQVSAGDSHCAALTEDGQVFAWGTFKDGNGNLGLLPGKEEKCWLKPQLISGDIGAKVIKIASGDHHLAMLTEDGKLFTCGNGEQGQLGRPVEAPASDPSTERMILRSRTRSSIANKDSTKADTSSAIRDIQLRPTAIKIRKKLKDVWCGGFGTYCKTDKSGEFYGFGLNNYGQLGLPVPADQAITVVRQPTRIKSLDGTNIIQIDAGQHHAVALSTDGKVWTFGRATDGRLGIGESKEEMFSEPQLLSKLEELKCVHVAAGLSTAYALTSKGDLYAWGFGSNYQLGTGNTDDLFDPTKLNNMVVEKKKTELNRPVRYISAGGLHVALTLGEPQTAEAMDTDTD